MINQYRKDRSEYLGSKILFIPPKYGSSASVTEFERFMGRDIGNEQAILRIFQNAGFFIERNGSFSGKQGELAFGLYNILAHGSHRVLDGEIAKSTGVPRPQEYTLDEVRRLNFPLVVKNPNAHGGQGIFLLENKEAWIRFVARAMMVQKLSDLFYDPNPDAVIAAVMDGVNKWNFDNEWFYFQKSDELEYYQFQEFVQTPSDYHTSFRILVDAYGEVYSGVLIRSAKKKGEERLNSPDMQRSDDPLEEISFSQRPYDILLMHPKSPFFINSPKIVSNAAQGGSAILLRGQPIIDEVDRQVLIDHGINPDNPAIPQLIMERAAAIGRAARGMNAYVGVDFIMKGKNMDPLFLEANFGPVLTPDEVGITPPSGITARSKVETSKYCQLALLSKIASK